MPAESRSQQRTAAVALQVKQGDMSLDDVKPAAFRQAVKSMLSMSKQDLEDFADRRKKEGKARDRNGGEGKTRSA